MLGAGQQPSAHVGRLRFACCLSFVRRDEQLHPIDPLP